MLGLRQKLLIAFTGIALLLLAVAGLGSVVIDRVAQSFDTIFHDNLASIEAARGMREAAEAMDQAVATALWDGTAIDTAALAAETAEFRRRLEFQQGNLTVTGEKAATDGLAGDWQAYRTACEAASRPDRPLESRRLIYANDARPRLRALQERTRLISDMNSRNILSADGQARAQARSARKAMTLLLSGAGALVLAMFFLLGRAILSPIRALTRSAQEIERGNLDLDLEARSRDELGQLALAFNAMAARLREFRRSDQAKLMRTQQATQTAIDSLPDAVAVIGADGVVEMSNVSARDLFGIRPGAGIADLGMDWLDARFQRVARDLRPFNPEGYESAIQVFPGGKEQFFLPHLLPILDQARVFHGVTLVLANVTGLRKLDESKSDLLATVSHELKTRLTSVRMAVHLLLDDKIGEMNPRQAELLLTAREDTERLHRIIEGLLDIGRIRSGNLKMRLVPMEVAELVRHSLEPSRHAFLDKGLKLDCADLRGLPRVMADPSRVHLILANLLSNAQKYTPPGGSVGIRASSAPEGVCILVSDSGAGIPAEDFPRVFEKFYRGAREGEPGGAGLGLAIAKEVVEAHGGSISARNREGGGAEFRFTLPALGEGGQHG